MNGRKATLLRRHAERLSRDHPQVVYGQKIHPNGAVTSILEPCVKLAHRRLKRMYRSGTIVLEPVDA